MLAEERLRRGAHDKSLGKMVLSADGYDSAFGRKSLNVILLLLKKALGDPL